MATHPRLTAGHPSTRWCFSASAETCCSTLAWSPKTQQSSGFRSVEFGGHSSLPMNPVQLVQSCTKRAVCAVAPSFRKWSQLAEESCSLQLVSVAKYQCKVLHSSWPSLVWSAIVLCRWCRRQPKPWRVAQTWLFTPEGDSHPPHASSRQLKPNTVVLIVYRRAEINVFLVSENIFFVAVSGRCRKSFRQRWRLCPRWRVLGHEKRRQPKIVFCNSLDRIAMTVQFCSNFWECLCWFQAGLLVNKSPTFTVFSIATSALIWKRTSSLETQ